MTLTQHAFYDGSGIHAAHLNFLLRLSIGLLITVIAVFIVVGLVKLLEDGAVTGQMQFLFSLISLAFILMIIFTFVVA